MQNKPTQPHVISVIQKHGIEYLSKHYFINCIRHSKYKNLICLSYNQTNSDFSSVIVQECRGLIVDENQNFKIISFPYTKFFNYGEKLTHQINWKTAKIYEKADGSLAILYYYAQEWHVSSTSKPDGSGRMCFVNKNEKVISFRELFWQIWEKMSYKLPKDTNKCYFFEMVTPRHNLVVQHREETLLLHGARDLKTLKECHPEEIAKSNGWECVKPLDITIDGPETVLEMAKKLNPIENEGFVVCDDQFRRVKIKAPKYVLLSHLLLDGEQIRNRSYLRIVQSNESSEFLAYFPEHQKIVNEYKKQYERLCNIIQENYERLNHLSQKEFACEAQKLKKRYNSVFVGLLFAMRKGELLKDKLENMKIQKFELLLKSSNQWSI